MKKRSVNTLEV